MLQSHYLHGNERREPLRISPSLFLMTAYRTRMNSPCEVAEMSLSMYRCSIYTRVEHFVLLLQLE
jgi:hypothetical protein